MQCIRPTRNALKILYGKSVLRLPSRLQHGRHYSPRAFNRRPFASLSPNFFSDNAPGPSLSIHEAVNLVAENPLPTTQSSLRPSEASLAAAQAIRLCIQQKGISDAFFVLNSIRYAVYKRLDSSAPFKMTGISLSKPEFEEAVLQFGSDVSPRLSAHTLLHGLLKSGMKEEAFQLSRLLMAEGIKLRSVTLDTIVQSLVPVQPQRRRRGLSHMFPRREIPLGRATDVLLLRPSMMADQGMRFALHLMFLARRHRQRRTDNMFKLFMAATLLNGELIIFSLLFGWACRDWQTAFNLELKLDVLPEDHPLQETTKVEGLKLRLTHLQSESIFPDAEMLDKGLSVIDVILALDGELDSVSHRRLVALQALGNLAGLLERQQIPFAQISTLVRSMYKCPRVDDEIWIVGLGGCPERIKAYDYFHSVLEKLIQNVPKQPPAVRSKKALRPNSIVRAYTFPILPPLSVQSYNALLHYSLRHRLSPGMGNQLLRHMTVERYEPLAPDSVTTNILLRSATLLRKDEMSTDVLSALVSEQLQFITAPPQKTEIVVDERKWGRKLERVSTARVVIPPLRTDLDVYLITTYISYLVSRRQSQAVKELLFQIIPELDSKKYPTNESHDKAQRKFGREALLSGLQRAIWLGPVFLTCMLNALSKLGHPALADRVWQLAKKAEKCSWLRQHVPEREPWIFGPEVYTVMMDCYGQLSRRQKPWRLTLDPNRRISKRTAGHSVWGSFQYECQKLPDRNGPDVNALLHRFMGHAALQVFLRFMQLPKVHQQVTQLKLWLPPENLPKPDARFFNSALWVFRPRMKAQRTRLHREHLSQVQDAFTRTGVPAQDGGWNPALQQVAEHMVASGYPIPYGLRYLFVGHLENMGDAAPVDRRPGVFAHGRYQPSGNQRFRLPTVKHRGLPLAKRYRASRRNR